jgi:4-hydroxyphenylacetate 3-monooxygenase
VARIVDEDAGGITIRGAKMLGTSSIMANEVFVANLQPLKPGEEALGLLLRGADERQGLRVLSRKSYEAAAVSVFDNPISSRFDENDALIYFDDVKVPWERVFVHRDTDMCRAQFHDTPGTPIQNYQAQIRLTVKLAFLAGLARRLTEAIGTTKMPPVAEQLGIWRPRSAASCDAVRHRGIGLAARRVVGAEQTLHVLGAGADPGALSTPGADHPRSCRRRADHAAVFGARFRQPGDGGDHQEDAARRYDGAGAESEIPQGAWDAIGSEFGSRHTQYEMFYAGARFVTAGPQLPHLRLGGSDRHGRSADDSYQLADELGRAN